VERTPDAVIGQLLRYMGWVRKNLAMEKSVYGIVVVGSTSEKLKYAASEAPLIQVMQYELQFILRNV
jgi:hypothetical protein